MPLALLALAIGAFGIGTTEFVIMGLLPEVADEFHVSIPTAGYATTGYGLGVAVGAPLLTLLGTRLTRKQMLVMLMGLFIAGNLLSALAPAFLLLLAGRVLAAFAHGAFFGIGAVVAADLVAPHKRAQAIATMFTGLTVANVIGVPMGTWIGQTFGWRASFLAVAGLGVLGLVGIAALVPSRPGPAVGRLGQELAAFRNPQVWLAMIMTVLGFGGVFAAITYITPMMVDVAGYPGSAVTWLLVLFGLGLVGGNLIGGRYADRALMRMLYLTLGGLAVVLAAFGFTAHNKIAAAATLVLVGAFGFATVAPLQKRVMDQAPDAPTLASAANIGAFNLGNALAAWLGGIVISAGMGYTAPNWVGALMAAAALGTAVLSATLERRTARTGRIVAAGGLAAADEPREDATAVR
ncbi:major facilitator superfamily permease [Streptomyces bingchenggensis BCW-1]|uniref:Major facilitator superfamily permease n=1 Tax=Streptomyces bingchenggensis (strain BCW-1) TaxID=749414 RepID=D7C8R0_STRBB|nr:MULTISPECIES: MFS transporter [Streptomyces]ADI08461.1 major facilitator superfamily permease [Streptomyces bingchenggensis BCW-1]